MICAWRSQNFRGADQVSMAMTSGWAATSVTAAGGRRTIISRNRGRGGRERFVEGEALEEGEGGGVGGGVEDELDGELAGGGEEGEAAGAREAGLGLDFVVVEVGGLPLDGDEGGGGGGGQGLEAREGGGIGVDEIGVLGNVVDYVGAEALEGVAPFGLDGGGDWTRWRRRGEGVGAGVGDGGGGWTGIGGGGLELGQGSGLGGGLGGVKVTGVEEDVGLAAED